MKNKIIVALIVVLYMGMCFPMLTKAQDIKNMSLIQIAMIVKLDSAIKADTKNLCPKQYNQLIKSMKKSVKYVNKSNCAYSRGEIHQYKKNLESATYWYLDAKLDYNFLRIVLGKELYKETVTHQEVVEMFNLKK